MYQAKLLISIPLFPRVLFSVFACYFCHFATLVLMQQKAFSFLGRGVLNHIGVSGRLLFSGETDRCSSSACFVNAANSLFSETLDSNPFAFSRLEETIKGTSDSKQTT